MRARRRRGTPINEAWRNATVSTIVAGIIIEGASNGKRGHYGF
jgi:hypothetical protein